MLFKCSFIQSAFPVPQGINHDTWFFLLSCSRHGFIHLNRIITKYRQHEKNTSGRVKVNYKNIASAFYKTIFKKGVSSTRMYSCGELLDRVPDMDDEIRTIVLEAKCFLENRRFFYIVCGMYLFGLIIILRMHVIPNI